MADVYSTVSVITLTLIVKVHQLKVRDCQSRSKNKTQQYVVYTKPILNIKTYAVVEERPYYDVTTARWIQPRMEVAFGNHLPPLDSRIVINVYF